jgi:vitamin B12 transporter
MTRLPTALAAAAVALAALPAAAQDPTTYDKTVGEVVVSATRTPLPQRWVASAITVIPAAEIEQLQLRSLPDALRTTPGIDVVQTGGPGGQTSVFARGANSDHVLVLIDGVEANDPAQPSGFDFGQILLDDVERIEVLRGPQSSLYGSDAIGGVINLITRGPGAAPGGSARLEAGSFGTFDQALAANGRASGLGYALSLSHFRSEDTPVTPPELLAPGERAIGEGYDNLTASGRLSAALSPDLELGFSARYARSILRFTGDDFSVFPSIPAPAQSVQDRGELFARAEARQSLFGGALKSVLGVSLTDYRTHEQDPDLGFGAPDPIVSDGRRVAVDWQGDIALAKNETLVLGLGDKNFRLDKTAVPARDEDRWAFAELESEPFPGLSTAASLRLDDYRREGSVTTWRIGATYTVPTTGTRLSATAGTGFKAPTLADLFVSFPAFGFFANPDLKPERSFGWDAGLEQPLAAGRARVGATFFHNDITDLIEPVFDAASFTSTLINLDRARTWGVESFASARLGEGFEVRGQYTFTDARDAASGDELLRRPRHSAGATATWRGADHLTLTATATYVGSWIDANRSFTIPRLKAPAYATFDLAGDWRLSREAVVFARVENLFDRRYQQPVGFLRPGRGLFAGVRLRFDDGV